jgi:hypothetical protein
MGHAVPDDDVPTTSADRLRAVLRRARTASHEPPAALGMAARGPVPPSPGGGAYDSDFDAPSTEVAGPSLAQESLKQLFAQFGTPATARPLQGRRARSGSVGESPQLDGVRRDKGKEKRKSLSDDEIQSG